MTGPPASGKTTDGPGGPAAAREGAAREPSGSSRTRCGRILTPGADYSPAERDRFYARGRRPRRAAVSPRASTSSSTRRRPRRKHRDRLRERVPDLPRGARRRAARDARGAGPQGPLSTRPRGRRAPHLPGATAAYEEPERPDLVLSGTALREENAGQAAPASLEKANRWRRPHRNDATELMTARSAFGYMVGAFKARRKP